MKQRFVFILFWVLLASSPPAFSQTITPEFRGYVKELGSLSFSNDFGTFRYDNILHHRIESLFDFNNGFEFRADLRNRLLNGFTVENTPGYADLLDEDAGFVDLSWILIDSRHTILHSTIDRLQVSYFNGPWEATLGRQRINWGKTYVWNPNDLFNAYAYLDFDYEERPGTDAFSASYSWSYASSIQLGYRFGDSFNESVIAGMLRGNLGEYDIQAIAASYFDKLMIGGGWSGYLKTAGFNGEFSYFHPRENFFDQTGHFTATIGGDYMFANSLYFRSEFLYNGGYERGGNTLAQLTRPPSADNLFISETGYFVNASYPVSPLTNINLGVLGSFDDPMVIFIPQLSYSLSENLDVLILSQLLKGALLRDITETPNVLFFRVKWSY